MAYQKDINGLQARSWPAKNIKELAEVRPPYLKNSNVELFEQIRQLFANFILQATGKAQLDVKDAFIIDLLISRIDAAFSNLSDDVSADEVVAELQEKLEQKLDEINFSENENNQAVQALDSAVSEVETIKTESASETPTQLGQTSYDSAGKIAGDEFNIYAPDSLNKSIGDQIDKIQCIKQIYINSTPTFKDNGVFCQPAINSCIYGDIKTIQDYVDKSDINGLINCHIAKKNNKDSDKDKNDVQTSVDPGLVKPGRDYQITLNSLGPIHSNYINSLNQTLSKIDKIQIMSLIVYNEQAIGDKKSLLKKLAWLTNPWVRIFKKIRDYMLKKMFNGGGSNRLKRFFSKFKIITNILNSIKNSKFIKWIFKYINGFMNNISNMFAGLKKLYANIHRIIDSLKRGWAYLKDTIKKMLSPIVKALKVVWRVIKQIFNKTMKLIRQIPRLIVKGIRQVLSLLWKGIKFICRIVWNLFKRIIGPICRFIKNIGYKVGRMIKSGLNKLGSKFKRTSNMFRKFTNGIKSVFNKIGNKVRSFKKTIVNAFKKVGDFFKSFKQRIVNSIRSFIGKIKSAVMKGLNKVVSVVRRIVTKIVTKIGQAIRKFVTKIMRKIGKDIAKKALKKSVGKMAFKFLSKWLAKFITKLIIKIGIKIAASAAVNAIPILGQIVAICMLIYNIYDTIQTCRQIYKLFEENPGLSDVIKDEAAKWAREKFNMLKDLCKAGAAFFKRWFIDGPKNLGHKLGDALFNSNKVMNKLKQQQTDQLRNFSKSHRTALLKIGLHDRLVLFAEGYNKYSKKALLHLKGVILYSKLIDRENDKFWRDTDLISQHLTERFELYKTLQEYLAAFGIFLTGDFYSGSYLEDLKKQVENLGSDLKETLTDMHKKLYDAFIKESGLNIAELKNYYDQIGDSNKVKNQTAQDIAGIFNDIRNVAYKKLDFKAA